MTTKRNASQMALSRILEYAAIGQSMNQEISAVLPDINGQEISDLCKLASDTRGQRSDKIVTFSPKVFIPLTRLCRDICGYCTFRQDPQNLSDLYMSPDAIIQVAEQGEKLGALKLFLPSVNVQNSNIQKPENGSILADLKALWIISNSPVS